jgi:hypothetical protein
MGWVLKMHAPHGSSSGSSSVVDLDNVPARHDWGQIIFTEQPFQKSAMIPHGLARQQAHPGNGCPGYFKPIVHAALS